MRDRLVPLPAAGGGLGFRRRLFALALWLWGVGLFLAVLAILHSTAH